MARNVTKITDLIDPEVMADMISAKLPNKIRVTPFAKVDDTLEGAEGDTITVPSFNYIGDAEDVAEGVECGTTKLTAGSRKAKVKKAMKAVELTDEAVLSGHGDPVGEATNQLGLAIASKVENDCIDALSDEDADGRLKYDGSASEISYEGIVDALDVFEEEVNGEKAMFVHPKQVTTLRKDPDFISADKYNQQVVLKGEIGMIANTRIVPSRRVKEDSTTNCYLNPIIKLETEQETEDEASALTIYIKRNVNVETERDTLARKTIISVDEIYTTAVSNDSKVVLAKFLKKKIKLAPNLEVPSQDVTWLNKKISDMIEPGAIVDENGNVKATLKKVEGFTDFSSEPFEQSGYYFPFSLTVTGSKMTFKKNGSETKKDIAFDKDIIFRTEKTDTWEVLVDGASVVKLNFANVAFAE